MQVSIAQSHDRPTFANGTTFNFFDGGATVSGDVNVNHSFIWNAAHDFTQGMTAGPDFSYDPTGRILKVGTRLEVLNDVGTTTYAYDGIDRRLQIIGPSGNDGVEIDVDEFRFLDSLGTDIIQLSATDPFNASLRVGRVGEGTVTVNSGGGITLSDASTDRVSIDIEFMQFNDPSGSPVLRVDGTKRELSMMDGHIVFNTSIFGQDTLLIERGGVVAPTDFVFNRVDGAGLVLGAANVNFADPTQDGHGATKGYVDSADAVLQSAVDVNTMGIAQLNAEDGVTTVTTGDGILDSGTASDPILSVAIGGVTADMLDPAANVSLLGQSIDGTEIDDGTIASADLDANLQVSIHDRPVFTGGSGISVLDTGDIEYTFNSGVGLEDDGTGAIRISANQLLTSVTTGTLDAGSGDLVVDASGDVKLCLGCRFLANGITFDGSTNTGTFDDGAGKTLAVSPGRIALDYPAGMPADAFTIRKAGATVARFNDDGNLNISDAINLNADLDASSLTIADTSANPRSVSLSSSGTAAVTISGDYRGIDMTGLTGVADIIAIDLGPSMYLRTPTGRASGEEIVASVALSTTNTADLTALDGRVGSIENTNIMRDASISALEGDVGILQTGVATNTGDIGTNTMAIGILQAGETAQDLIINDHATRLTAAEGDITSNTTAIAGNLAATAVFDGDVTGTFNTIDINANTISDIELDNGSFTMAGLSVTDVMLGDVDIAAGLASWRNTAGDDIVVVDAMGRIDVFASGTRNRLIEIDGTNAAAPLLKISGATPLDPFTVITNSTIDVLGTPQAPSRLTVGNDRVDVTLDGGTGTLVYTAGLFNPTTGTIIMDSNGDQAISAATDSFRVMASDGQMRFSSPAPLGPDDAANKFYVDAAVAGVGGFTTSVLPLSDDGFEVGLNFGSSLELVTGNLEVRTGSTGLTRDASGVRLSLDPIGGGLSEVAGGLRIQDGGVTTAKILDGTIQVLDLAYDPATQTELGVVITSIDANTLAIAGKINSVSASGALTATETGGDVDLTLNVGDGLLVDANGIGVQLDPFGSLVLGLNGVDVNVGAGLKGGGAGLSVQATDGLTVGALGVGILLGQSPNLEFDGLGGGLKMMDDINLISVTADTGFFWAALDVGTTFSVDDTNGLTTVSDLEVTGTLKGAANRESKTVTCADNGASALPGTVTVTVDAAHIVVTQLDPQGCDVTVAKPPQDGTQLTISCNDTTLLALGCDVQVGNIVSPQPGNIFLSHVATTTLVSTSAFNAPIEYIETSRNSAPPPQSP